MTDIDQKSKEHLIANAIVRLVRAETMLAKLRLLPLTAWPQELETIRREATLGIGALEEVRARVVFALGAENEGDLR